MAYSERLVRYTYTAGASLVQYVGVPGMPGSVDPNLGTQYLIAKDGTSQDVAEKATAGTDVLIGVTTTKSQHLDMPVAIATSGRVPVQAGAAILLGAKITANAAGKAVTATGGDKVLGTAVEPAAGPGVLVTVQLELGK